jgi:thiosulfate/3-mercaptopyruvate sulfurtransferase
MSAVISAADLRQYLGRSGIRIIDATYPPQPGVYRRARIGNAVPFDIDAVADHTIALPHMLPAADDFAAAAGALGIGNEDTVIVYDQTGMAMAASRVWWMFRCFGHKDVRVLDGGLPAWMAADYPVATGLFPIEPAQYQARLHPALVRNSRQVRESMNRADTLIIDARPPERFYGLMPEPRPGMRAGHIPGSINIPFPDLIDPATGRLKANHLQVLEAVATGASSIITTCGSGVTACLLALALFEAGRPDTAVYDGSWAEWGGDSGDMPVEI